MTSPHDNLIVRILTAATGWVHRHFTPAGRFLLVVLVIAALVGMDTNQSLAYQVFTFLAVTMTLAFLAGRTARSRLQAERRLPGSAMAGEAILYQLTIRNLDSKSYSDITVSESVGGDAVMWLPESVVAKLPPLGVSEINAEVVPQHRGKLNLTGVAVSLPDALGITRRRQDVPAHSSVLVLPKRYTVPAVNLPGTREYQPGGVTLSSSIGESLEFESLREYRPGDPIRKIHWRSWARAGKLIVKEYQDEYFVRHGLVLDTFPTTNNPQVFEEAVSVAASFACSVLTQESLLDLLFVGTETYRFTAGRGLGGPEKMLEVLACVEPATARRFEDLQYNVVSRYDSLSGCICVLLAWDDARQGLIRHLESLRVPVLAVVISDPALNPVTPPASGNIRVLELGKIAEGLARL